MRIILLIVSLFLPFHMIAQSAYYNGTTGLQGYTLKAKLHELVSNKSKSWNYGDLPYYFEQTDRDVYYENDSSVLDIYSENPAATDPYNYHYEDNDLIGSAGSEGLGWNREHIYSQSFFDGNYPMYSDLHFIVPTDARVNQRRSNFPFAPVGNSPAFTSLNGTKVGPANLPGYTYTVTEPIAEFKGDVARMLMFMAVRYENLVSWFEYDNVRNPVDSVQEKGFKNWYIPVLLAWHQQDPVSQKEIDRNNAVYEIQGNRNPFVDHPEFAQAVWGNLPNSPAVPVAPYQVNVVTTGKRFITVSWPYVNDPEFLGYEVFLDGVFVGSTKSTSYTFDHLEPATNYDIKVRTYSKSYVRSTFTSPITASTTASDDFSTDIYISKIIEGTDYNKVIEITNTTGHDIDLRNYFLNMRQINNINQNLYWSGNKLQLEGVLPNNKSMVIIHPKANLACFSIDSAHTVSSATAMNFDGTLAIDLTYKNVVVDRLGYSDVVMNYANNRSLYRKPEIKNPTFQFDTAQWVTHPLNYCDGLGGPLNIKKHKIAQKFKIYPNPAKGQVFVAGKNLQNVQSAVLISLDGRRLKVYENPFVKGNALEIPAFVKGLVILSIDGESYRLIAD